MMSSYTCLEIIAILLLSLIAFIILFKIGFFLWNYYLASLLGFGVQWRPAKNVWAVVTGATDGIGLQYARQLAEKGYSLMIISRNEHKLSSVAKQLKEEYADCDQVKTVCADFGKTDIYGRIGAELDKLETIDVLVNNVGVAYNYMEYFAKVAPQFNDTYVNVNVVSATKMMELLLPRMTHQKRGIVINVSSQAAVHPVPLMSAYSATKAYLSALSKTVSVEYASKGITIQTVEPNQVKTKLAFVELPFFAITADEFVRAALKTVGIEAVTYGHWKHRLLGSIFDLLCLVFGEQLLLKGTMASLEKHRADYYQRNNMSDD